MAKLTWAENNSVYSTIKEAVNLKLAGTLQGDLSHLPLATLVPRLGPDWTAQWPWGLCVHIEGTHGSSIHVIVECQAFPIRTGEVRAQETSFLSTCSGSWGLDVHVVSYKQTQSTFYHIIQALVQAIRYLLVCFLFMHLMNLTLRLDCRCIYFIHRCLYQIFISLTFF